MAVLAVLAALSFRGLNSILDAETHVTAETQRWKDAGTLSAQIGNDLSLAMDRPVRDSAGGVRAALVMHGVDGPGAEEGQLVISRLGDREGGSSQGDLRRVGYRLRDGTLEYLVWPALDSAPGSAPLVSPAMENVADLRLRALGHDGSWSAVWPAGGQLRSLPRAIEVQLALSGGARITRLFPLR